MLSDVDPLAVGSVADPGTGLLASREDHVHVGVHSIRELGEADLYGDVTLSSGLAISMSQVLQDIQISVVPNAIDHGLLAGLLDDDHPQYTAWAQDEVITGSWTFDADVDMNFNSINNILYCQILGITETYYGSGIYIYGNPPTLLPIGKTGMLGSAVDHWSIYGGESVFFDEVLFYSWIITDEIQPNSSYIDIGGYVDLPGRKPFYRIFLHGYALTDEVREFHEDYGVTVDGVLFKDGGGVFIADVDMSLNYILKMPDKHVCPFALIGGAANVYIETFPAGEFTQDLHISKIVVSVDAAPGAGKTVTVTVSDGVHTMTVTISDAETKGSTIENAFDWDASATSLTLHYSQTAGGLAKSGTIICVHHYIATA